MKPTTRGTLAAVVTCVAAAAAAATAATPAAASTVPVPLPLDGVERSLHMEMPHVAGELPVPVPGAPEGTRFAEGHLLPERTLPRLPVSGGLPGGDVRAPLPHVLGEGFDHLGVSAPAADLRTAVPGLALDTPLGRPDAENGGLPSLSGEPRAALDTPLLRTVPGAEIVTGPGA
ncbi:MULTISPECIES: hypothetical protein [Streptomyces]|jgi:hypothetical protein|uniref:GLTT repeat-containing protein n=1 Tax=Streptomyces griseoaurantiacus TaxID=68213 RepID=A0A1G7BIU8_9ACTN|nr:hypothetical protein [Streptomyces jietaisiensis]SDE27051.1 hypothetical protein SAMN05216260_101132 [Streptomyces jietaisiensis]